MNAMNRFLTIYVTMFFFVSLIVTIVFTGCAESPNPVEIRSEMFVVRDFIPLSNWHIDSAGQERENNFINKSIVLDYSDAIDNGFLIPTINQVKQGRFEFDFYIKNTGNSTRNFLYKLFYQNESYKYPETDKNDSARQNIYACENFYGSWEDTAKGFAETLEIPADNEFHKVTGSFRIMGNPRNEQRYFGNGTNERWKRNPRVGNYSFLLVVTSGDNLNLIPGYIQNISLTNNGTFINPYFYFIYGDGRKLRNTIVQKSPNQLKVIAKPDPGAGIYVKPVFFKAETAGKYFCKTCGQDENP